MEDYFVWYKILHIVSVISWMAALLYLPRLFVYHAKVEVGSEMDKTFQIMERRLLKAIMTPAMLFTYIFGFLTAYVYGFIALGAWFHIKMLAVLGLTTMHGFCAMWVKSFARGENKNSHNFYRVVNEVPTILMIVSVIMVIAKPFD